MGKIADGGALGGVGWGREVGGVRRRERFAGDVLLAIGRLWGEDVFRGGISGVYCRIRGLFGGGIGLGGFWVGLGHRRGGLDSGRNDLYFVAGIDGTAYCEFFYQGY